MHWASKYVGKKCNDENDCFQWFRTIRKEVFGDIVPNYQINPCHRTLNAAKLMASNIKDIFGWRETGSPKEGDAVFLSQKTRPHHLGMVVFIRGKMRILHGIDDSGIICSDLNSLHANGWKITGYFTNAA